MTTRDECGMDDRNRWVNHRYNFDNLGQVRNYTVTLTKNLFLHIKRIPPHELPEFSSRSAKILAFFRL